MAHEHPKPTAAAAWAPAIPDEEWRLYRPVLEAAQQRGLGFALGGGFAFSFYVGRWRNTKDIDLYILPQDRDAFTALLSESGFEDYFDRLPYDRSWIYRSYREGVIIDIIWQMANGHAQVDERWVTRGPVLELRGVALRALPVEELIWAKLYVLQRDRCDWPDLLNILYAQAPSLDWDHLIERAGGDALLLSGLMCVFRWLCPQRAGQVPEAVWRRLELPREAGRKGVAGGRRPADLLDSRDWFGADPQRGEPC